mgnify:CR=1 FL=1
MSKNQFTFNDLPEVLGVMRPNRKYGKFADRKAFQAERSQGEHARPHDRAGGLRLSQNAAIDLLLQG